MSEDEFEDLVEKYRSETIDSIESEAVDRISENLDHDEEERLKSLSLIELSADFNNENSEFVRALYARLGAVRSALVGHGGGIITLDVENPKDIDGLALTLTLDGACIACGAAPGTLIGIQKDLESDKEISKIKYSSELLDSFGELGKEFLLSQTNLEFV